MNVGFVFAISVFWYAISSNFECVFQILRFKKKNNPEIPQMVLIVINSI